MFFFTARAKQSLRLLRDTLALAAWYRLQMSQCYVIKQMVNAIACTVEL